MNRFVQKWQKQAIKQAALPQAKNPCCTNPDHACSQCNGHGTITKTGDDDEVDVIYCPRCQGSGLKQGETK